VALIGGGMLLKLVLHGYPVKFIDYPKKSSFNMMRNCNDVIIMFVK
jgi:hypothetical protein